MYVVIVGGGKIGRYIAKDLESKGHEVTVIERHPGRCEQLVAETSVLVIEGDAGDVRYLEQAHLDRADRAGILCRSIVRRHRPQWLALRCRGFAWLPSAVSREPGAGR